MQNIHHLGRVEVHRKPSQGDDGHTSAPFVNVLDSECHMWEGYRIARLQLFRPNDLNAPHSFTSAELSARLCRADRFSRPFFNIDKIHDSGETPTTRGAESASVASQDGSAAAA